jgi:hypothetical protein
MDSVSLAPQDKSSFLAEERTLLQTVMAWIRLVCAFRRVGHGCSDRNCRVLRRSTPPWAILISGNRRQHHVSA